MRGTPVSLPECGLLLGTGVYATAADYLLSTLYAHQFWVPETNHPLQMLDRVLQDNQGNLVQLWGGARGYAPATYALWLYALDEIGVSIPEPDWRTGQHTRASDSEILRQHQDRLGAGALRFVKAAAQRGLYSTLIYVNAPPQWSRPLQDVGHHYLGYDYGERFTFRFDEQSLQGQRLEDISLTTLTDDLIRRVREVVDIRHAAGWGNVMATSLNFYIDYEIVAGTDIPVIEDFAFSHLNFASALSRGLYRQFELPLWGAHLAHEHYSWIPYRHPRKFELLTAALYLKYMAGCKMIINESGNWLVEGSLCEDSPKFAFPRVPLPPGAVAWNGQKTVDLLPFIPAAREHYHQVGYDSPVCRQYRRVISDFYDFVKQHGTPQGQPETTLALAKGNLDLCGHRYSPNAAVGGAYTLAETNPQWFEGAPERGWEIAKNVFYPLMPVLEPCPNRFLSGTPWGMVDIVTFAKDQITVDFLVQHYKALLFTGWNTASAAQYEILTQYVTRGGTLFIGLAHLSTNDRRNYASFTRAELVHGGDFSALCGLKIAGRGRRIYWATAPEHNRELGFAFPRRFGIIQACLGEIDIVAPDVEALVVDDEQAQPVLLRRRLGAGWVYFLNTWAYPGAVNTDEGPGATTDSPGLIGMVYRHIARRCRGRVWISDDGVEPRCECRFIAFSWFPEAQRVCLYNIDGEQPHRFQLHGLGPVQHLELAPGAFRMFEATAESAS